MRRLVVLMLVGLFVTASFFFAAPARAQGFRLGTWGGSVEGVVDFNRSDTETEGARTTQAERTRTEERVNLRNNGTYIYDPELLTLSLGGTFGLSQDRFETEGTRSSRDATLDGYNVIANILRSQRTSLDLFADRDRFFLSRELSGQTETVNENFGGTLFLRGLYIPSSLSFRRVLREDESRVANVVSRREDRRNTFTYVGQRGWVDSEMDVRYELVDHTDIVFPDLSFRSQEGALNYSLDFGPELNWRWDSRLRASDRKGVSDLTIWNVNESLRIDHSRELQTTYRYFFNRNETPGGTTNTHTGKFSLVHRLYENIRTSLDLEGTQQTLPGGEIDILGGRLDFAYTKRLPREGRLNAGLGGSLRYRDNRFRVTETFVSQELHTAATPFALPFALNNPFVDAASVAVTKVGVGPLPAGCFPAPGPPTPLVLGRDYTLRTSGDVTEIVPLPCSGATPGINPGDTVAVDYRFAVSRSLTLLSKSWNASFSLDYPWIRPFFIHEQTDETLLSGRDGQFLEDRQSDTLGVELRYEGRRLRASVAVEAQRLKSSRQAFNAVRVRQFLGITFMPGLRLALNAGQSYAEFTRLRDQKRTLLNGRATLTYAFDANLVAEAFVRVDYLDDSLIPIERTAETGLRGRWILRQIEVSPRLEFLDRRRGRTHTKEYRAILRVVRRF